MKIVSIILIVSLMTIVFTGSAYGAEMDMSQAPCKFLEEGPNFSNKKDYTYGTNGKICVIRDTTNSGAATDGNIAVPYEDHRSHCGNIGYNDAGTYKQYQIPLKSGGNIAIAISGGSYGDMKDPFGQTAKLVKECTNLKNFILLQSGVKYLEVLQSDYMQASVQ